MSQEFRPPFLVLPFALMMLLASLASAAFAGGTVETARFDTPALGVAKSFRIYLPDGYAVSGSRFPVIYLLEGWGGTERTPTEDIGLTEAADEMNLQAIVVMPDPDRGMYVNGRTLMPYEASLAETEPTRNKREKREEFCVRTSNYEDYIIDDLVTYIDTHYRTIARREGRAVSGISMGGLGAMNLGSRLN